jgi:AraC-like DNA-binding protein
VLIRSEGCTTLDSGTTVPTAPGVGTLGTAGPDGTLLVCGLYTMDGNVSRPLLAALPPLAVVEAGVGSCPVSPALFGEVTREPAGQQVLLDRTMDLLLITALRAWFTRPGAELPAWYQAHGDPVVGPALRLLHADPAHRWTLESLAAKTGVSKANLVRRFTSLVGRPPMTYLRELRLTLAADLLREPDVTLAAVARQVGFSTPFALSTAFKRERGISPSEYRTATLPARA